MTHAIFEDNEIQLLYRPGSTDYALVTFTEFGFVPDGQRYWARAVCDARDIACVAFCARRANWYPRASVQAARAALTALRLPILIGYGTSMGGHAALKHSRLLGLAGTIACCPQFSIDPALISGQPQYTAHHDRHLNAGMEIEARDLCDRAIVVHDPLFREDVQHINLLRRACPSGLIEIRACFMGHHVPAALRNWELLQALIHTARTGADRQTCHALLRRQKKQEDRYKVTFAEQMLSRRRYLNVAHSLLERIPATTDGLVSIKKYTALSRIAALSGECGKAADLAMQAAHVQPDNPHLQAALGAALLSAERYAEAESAYAEAVSHRPTERHFHDGLAEARRRQAASVAA